MSLYAGPQCSFARFLILWFENHPSYLAPLIFQVLKPKPIHSLPHQSFIGNLSSVRLELSTIHQRQSPSSWPFQPSGGQVIFLRLPGEISSEPDPEPRALIPITALSPPCQQLPFVAVQCLGQTVYTLNAACKQACAKYEYSLPAVRVI